MSRTDRPWRNALCVIALATALVTGILLAWKYLWTNQARSDQLSDPSGASVVVGTFITLYSLFLAGFSGLAGFVNRKRVKMFWAIVAIAFLIEAAAVDLWRVLDSTGDLYSAATKGLSRRQLNDDAHDFKAYFALNVLVVAFVLAVACVFGRNDGSRRDAE